MDFISNNQLTDHSVEWLIDKIEETPQDIILLIEPEMMMYPEDQMFIPNVFGAFKNDSSLAMVCGKGSGHAFFKRDLMIEVFDEYSHEINDFATLIQAIKKKGFNIKSVKYIKVVNR